MHDLEAPDERARGGAEGDHRVGPLVVAPADSAVVVRAGAALRYEDEVVPGIDGESRPGVAAARARLRLLAPGDGIPDPPPFAAPDVEPAHDAAPRVHPPVVRDRRAHDHQVVADRRSGRDLVAAGPYGLRRRVRGEVDRPLRAEVRAGLSRFSVERDEPGIQGAHEHTKAARLAGPGLGIAPGGNAAGRDFGVAAIEIDLRIELPEPGARSRVEGDHMVVGGAEEEFSLDEDRRDLEG